MTLNTGTLQPYVDKGLITLRKHPRLPVYVAKYTAECAYGRQWDEVTLQCRGLVVDDEGIVGYCMPKFFNVSEHEQYDDLPDLEGATILRVDEKYDGSLIHVTRSSKYGLLISSSGSFESEQVAWAKKLVGKIDINYMKEDRTYVFELIHPENRIVVDYGQIQSLVLLDILDGRDSLMPFDPHAANIDWREPRENREGYVIRMRLPNGEVIRVKHKHEEYVRLHAIVTNLTEKRVIDSILDGTYDDMIAHIPDESWDWVRELADQFEYKTIELMIQAVDAARAARKHSDERREQAAYILSEHKDISGLVFSALDMKPIKPRAQRLLAKEWNDG